VTFLEAKIAARRLFPVPLLLERERNVCVVRVAIEHEVRRPGGATVYEARAELGRGASWLEAMRSAALTWTASLTVEHLQAKAEAEEQLRNSGRSSDQPGLISQASLRAAPGPAPNDAASSNGRMTGSDPVDEGSIPSAAAPTALQRAQAVFAAEGTPIDDKGWALSAVIPPIPEGPDVE
jgi:hypothetical protein